MSQPEWIAFAIARGMSAALALRMWGQFGSRLALLTEEDVDWAFAQAAAAVRKEPS